MNESVVVEKIEETLLEIVSHAEKPEIIFMEIDTSVSDIEDEGSGSMNIIPYLNIYGNAILNQHNIDDSILTAIKNDEFGYIADILDNIIWNDFEIKLVSLYPDWPDQLKSGDDKIITTVKNTINNNKEKFEHIKKLYFYYVDNLDFIKIIDKPA